MSFGVLIDVEGVLCRGSQLIPGAERFVDELLDDGVPFLLLVNDAVRTPLDVAMRLTRRGLRVDTSHVATCATATATLLAARKPDATAFILGHEGIISSLHRGGVRVVEHGADFVVVGDAGTLSGRRVEHAAEMVGRGATLVATHHQPAVEAIERALGTEALIVGLPSPIAARVACEQLGLDPHRVFLLSAGDLRAAAEIGCRCVRCGGGGDETWPGPAVESILHLSAERLRRLVDDPHGGIAKAG